MYFAVAPYTSNKGLVTLVAWLDWTGGMYTRSCYRCRFIVARGAAVCRVFGARHNFGGDSWQNRKQHENDPEVEKKAGKNIYEAERRVERIAGPLVGPKLKAGCAR